MLSREPARGAGVPLPDCQHYPPMLAIVGRAIPEEKHHWLGLPPEGMSVVYRSNENRIVGTLGHRRVQLDSRVHEAAVFRSGLFQDGAGALHSQNVPLCSARGSRCGHFVF